ncbi:MAG TPA: quinolinate synthase NadA [Bacteroidia bacterium]|nr:quinolinate synthase NadA [Bacteroidia bacterium]
MQQVSNEQKVLISEINRLKKEKNAVILVHNYQRPEIYEVADFIADSLELSRKAAETKADIIVFCGVKFMAETAKILNPEKTVLLPSLEAGCSLADMATVEEVKRMKNKFPDAAVVSYVNTNADVKAVSDICCTSANAVKVVNSLPQDEIIFLPDKNLGRYVQSKSKKKIHLWEGFCAVHQDLNSETLLTFKREHPDAKIIAHPECKTDILDVADYVCGTGGMAKFARQDEGGDFIVVTECGMTNKLREDVPGKHFYSFCNLCAYMKATTLELVLQSLKEEKQRIELPEEIIARAKKSIVRMLEAA